MAWYYILLIVLGSIIILMTILYPFILSYILFVIHVKRTSKKKWVRECSSPKNPEQLKMWNEGLEFISAYKDNIKEVSVTSEGLHLVGEYVDIGADQCVILLGGRCECLYYGYYYAKPYLTHHCNVLVIDQRAHGNSDGKYNTVGQKESLDIIQWAKLLHDTYHIKNIYIHGTCIGAATGIHALVNKDCPDYINKIIVDGLFTTFYDTFLAHMIDQKRPLHPYIDITFKFYKFFAKVDGRYNGPIYLIDQLKTDIMFLQSKEDKYVSKEECEKLYHKAGSKNKELHYLNHGNHSHIRVNQPEEYDQYVIDFLGLK